MAKKNFFQRIIRSMGAWIGGAILLFIPVIPGPFGCCFTGFGILKNLAILSPLSFFIGISPIIVGALIGYFIEKQFFKTKRRKK